MTINTESIRDAAEVLDTLTSTLAVDHPLRTQAAARAKSRVSGLYSAVNALDAQTAEIARLREALLWTAGALQMACKVDVIMGEADGISINNETRTVAQILDAADAALAQEQGDSDGSQN